MYCFIISYTDIFINGGFRILCAQISQNIVSVRDYEVDATQGFMQDKIIASHTYFGGHMDVNC